MFEKKIKEYESLLEVYREKVTERMAAEDWKEYNEILFSAHSCAIEGNSFSVNDTRELKDKGLGVIPKGKTLFEAFEMLDHFKAYEYLFNQPEAALSEELLKETHRILTEHTDEHLISFFFQTAINRMKQEMEEKKIQNRMNTFLF